MSDLINRQDAIDAVMALPNCENGYSDTYDKAYIIGVLEELPSAQPEIIMCKDCKHYYYTDNRVFGEKTWVCDILNFEDLDEDEFCARAERRTE